MASKSIITGLVLTAALAAVPAVAEEGQHRRAGSDRQRSEAQAPPDHRERAVPRAAVPRAYESQGQADVQRRNEAQRQVDVQRQFDNRRQVWTQRTQPYYAPRGAYAYRPRTIIVPRVIRPAIVTVVPYRPYFYHPSLSLGVFYGANGAYPYGYIPQGYYDPIPGRPYGGVRITGAPRDAQVFADGYYVGIVNDFDGVFQHMNLEAGPHHIEIQEPGFEPIAFDVVVQPGQTVTFRADMIPN
jgi:hypothetical protein